MRKRRLKVYKKKSNHSLLVILGVVILGLLLGRACRDLPRFTLPESEDIILYRSAGRYTEQMDFERYLVGVVAAEMPASFDLEALKAQAVCARTYTYQRLLNGYTYPLGAQVSDDPGTCQAYVSKEEFAAAHPQDTVFYYQKIEQAVAETAGEILIFEGRPVEALYHSTCGGQTEEAADIWGKEAACLHSVPCRWCGNSGYYRKELFFSQQDFAALLGVEADATLQIQEQTSSGRVKRAEIGGKEFSGEEIRSRLGLPSTWFSMETTSDGVKLITRGFGHGLGLCQYGAGGMAAEGYNYREILSHYYEGANIYSL